MPTIVTRYSAAAGVAPSAGQLVIGELAVNVTDRKLYTLDGTNNVVLLSAGGVDPTDPFSIIVNDASPALTIANNGSGLALYISAGNVDIQTGIMFGVNATAKTISWGVAGSTEKATITGVEGNSGYLAFGTDGSEKVRITALGGLAFNGVSNYGTLGQALISQGDAPPVWTDQYSNLTFLFSGAGSPILTGFAGDIQVPFAGTIIEASLVADQVGNFVVGISKSSYAAFPGGLASIVASAPPTLTAAQKSTDSTLTGWTTSIAANDVLRFTVNTASAVTSVTLTLKIKRA